MLRNCCFGKAKCLPVMSGYLEFPASIIDVELLTDPLRYWSTDRLGNRNDFPNRTEKISPE